MSLISINDFEITKGNKISQKCMYVKEALRRLRIERKTKIQGFEEVVDPFELILKCYELSDSLNKKKGNTNARRI